MVLLLLFFQKKRTRLSLIKRQRDLFRLQALVANLYFEYLLVLYAGAYKRHSEIAAYRGSNAA
jgi:hypothetical protein